MGIIANVARWNADRYKIIQLRHDLAYMDECFEALKRTTRFKAGSEEARKQYWDHFGERDLTQAELDELQSKRAVERARYWGVPLPQRPTRQREKTEFWDWSTVHGQHYLSEKGKMLLRRECSLEMEMFYKPWATWLAVGISSVALFVAVFKT
jgi:hypothetical protein